MSDVYIPPNEQRGSGMKWFFGCGCGCLTLIIVLIAIIVAAGFYIKSMVDDWKTEFKDLGFNKVVQSQMLTVSEDITEPTLFIGQMVKITGTVTTNIAIIAQISEISGTIDGTVYFRGQNLTIKESGVLKKDLDVFCQMIDVKGTVEEDITGQYQILSPPQIKTE